MQIKEYQQKVEQWIQEYGVRYFNELTNTVILMEEVGEFSRYISRIYGEQSFKETVSEEEAKIRLKQELGDIYFVLTCLANQMSIDLENVLLQNLEKMTLRDSDRHKKNKKIN